MVYNKFGAGIFIRVVLLTTLLVLLALALTDKGLYLTCTGLSLAAILTVWELYRFASASRRDLADFLSQLEKNDFTRTWNAEDGESGYPGVFNRIVQRFETEISSREMQYQYLQQVVQHLQVAVVCFGPDNQTDILNPEASRLLRLVHLGGLNELHSRFPALAVFIEGATATCSETIKLDFDDGFAEVVVHISMFKLKERLYKLVTIHDISQRLVYRELQAWKNLIRVINHEIVNSVAPVLSLGKTTLKLVRNSAPGEIHPALASDLLESLEAIERRSHGLLGFVDNFRSFAAVTVPKPELFDAGKFLKDICTLMQPGFGARAIDLAYRLPDHECMIYADRGMTERIVINLLLNASEAIEHTAGGIITLSAGMEAGMTEISVIDNGKGIPAPLTDKIFIPFFTTKEKGSGIGLSVCLELATLNNGHIVFSSVEGEGTCFRLRLPGK